MVSYVSVKPPTPEPSESAAERLIDVTIGLVSELTTGFETSSDTVGIATSWAIDCTTNTFAAVEFTLLTVDFTRPRSEPLVLSARSAYTRMPGVARNSLTCSEVSDALTAWMTSSERSGAAPTLWSAALASAP